MTTELLDDSWLLTPSTLAPFPAVKESGANFSTSETNHQWCIFHCYALKFTFLVTLILVQVLPLKNIFNPQGSRIEFLIVVWRSNSPSISLTALCDFEPSNVTTILVTVLAFRYYLFTPEAE